MQRHGGLGLPAGHFNGVPIYIAKPWHVPKLKLCDSVNVSDRYRERFNEWLLTTFGFTQYTLIPDGQVINAGGRLIMTEATFQLVQRSLETTAESIRRNL